MFSWIQHELSSIRAREEYRTLETWEATGPYLTQGGRTLLNLAGNDYLGLTVHPAVREAAARAARDLGPGATASRLLVGTSRLHDEMEQQLAAWKGHPTALLFSSGYLAALGAITVLAGRDDLIVADRLSHACLIDAARLSGATLTRYKHNDLQDAERRLATRGSYRRCLMITESIFSMDGDRAPITDLLATARQHDAFLLVDEAHALGVAGPRGAGLTADAPESASHLVTLGTLGKSLASAGGFVTCSAPLRELLINQARTFIFDTALPPPSVAAAQAALSLLVAHPEWPVQLQQLAGNFTTALQSGGLPVRPAVSPIIPIILREAGLVLQAAQHARKAGLLVAAIRPPTVPPHTSRLRLSVSLGHRPADLDEAARTLCSDLSR
jgi:glycine C-acetyltransferase/8-amino-7-oxononanoate synthase